MDIKTIKLLFGGLIGLGLIFVVIGGVIAIKPYLIFENANTQQNIQPVSTTSINEPKESITIEIPAKIKWFDTGVDVPTGGYVVIKYKSGTWSNGGDVPLFADAKGSHAWEGLLVPNAPIRSLVGKIGSNTFFVGNYHRGQGKGRLYLCINDTPSSYNDNQGSIEVDVSIEERSK